MKILAIQFRYLGDAALMTPALRAIKQHFPGCALHVLVAEGVVPLFQHLPWLERVWAFPRTRGKARLRQSWPLIRALRREQFDRSVDFGSGDRSALISLLCGARQRLAPFSTGGFLGRRYCYTQSIEIPESRHEALRHLRLLSAWGIVNPGSLEMEIHSCPAWDGVAARLLPQPAILCHLTTGQPKKEWPLAHWAEFYRQAKAAGYQVVFSTGATLRERAQLEALRKLAPGAPTVPPDSDLATFLAVLKRARLFVTGDTGPLHFAAGLGVPTVALFGPSSASQWAPFGRQHQALQGGHCTCGGDTAVCHSADPCMAALLPEAVLRLVSEALAASTVALGQRGAGAS